MSVLPVQSPWTVINFFFFENKVYLTQNTSSLVLGSKIDGGQVQQTRL